MSFHIPIQMRTFVLCALVSTFALPPSPAGADAATTYQYTIKPALVLVAAQDANESSFGTGFCIYSKNGVSYFVTDYHVVADEQTDRAYPSISVVLPSDPSKRYVATLLKGGSASKDWPPDLAVISARIGKYPTIRISSQRPLEGIPVGIAGFPAFQLKVWLDQSQGTELRPSFHEGEVNALTLGDFYVQYDALTDQGNSGGPLFDTRTGAVYGVVDETVKGNSVNNNLALSEVVLRRFIASLALPIKTAAIDKRLTPPADERASAHASDACTTALERFSKHFDQLVNARTLAAASNRGLRSAVMARYALLEGTLARHELAGDVDSIQRSGAKSTAKLADAIYDDVRTTPGTLDASPKLKADVLRFDTLGDCSTDT